MLLREHDRGALGIVLADVLKLSLVDELIQYSVLIRTHSSNGEVYWTFVSPSSLGRPLRIASEMINSAGDTMLFSTS